MTERFIIGIGSQRAGTTLLHSLLSETSDAFMHPVKELHYFDTLFGIRDPSALREFSMRQLKREINRIVSNSDLTFASKRRYKCMLRTNMLLATTPVSSIEYKDLYRPFLSSNRALGEITPEYMLLDQSQAEKMKSVAGEDATIILIRRDPVDRVLSAAKLYNVYNSLKMDSEDLTAWLHKMISEDSSWILAQDKYNDYYRASEIFGKLFERFIAIDYDDLVQRPKHVASTIANIAEISIDVHQFAERSQERKNSLGEQELSDPCLRAALKRRYEARVFIETETTA